MLCCVPKVQLFLSRGSTPSEHTQCKQLGIRGGLQHPLPPPQTPTWHCPGAIYIPVSSNFMPGASCVTQVCAEMHYPFNKAAACCYKGMSFCSNQAELVQTLPKH